jgi:hypothetical protein
MPDLNSLFNNEIKFETYIVKNWDKLWNIVKTHYKLDDNKQIADKVNKVVAFNVYKWNKLLLDIDNYPVWWDWINWDNIKIWDKIILPN